MEMSSGLSQICARREACERLGVSNQTAPHHTLKWSAQGKRPLQKEKTLSGWVGLHAGTIRGKVNKGSIAIFSARAVSGSPAFTRSPGRPFALLNHH